MGKNGKNSYIYEKYLKKYDPSAPENIKKRKSERNARRKAWWATNWIGIVTMILTALTLLATIWFGLRSQTSQSEPDPPSVSSSLQIP